MFRRIYTFMSAGLILSGMRMVNIWYWRIMRCPSVHPTFWKIGKYEKNFPRTYQKMSVRSVEEYPELLLRSLEYLSPRKSQKPVCVLLTPGVYNSAYFEHTFLARQMGIEIVEGKDLIAIDGFVYMRTTQVWFRWM